MQTIKSVENATARTGAAVQVLCRHAIRSVVGGATNSGGISKPTPAPGKKK